MGDQIFQKNSTDSEAITDSLESAGNPVASLRAEEVQLDMRDQVTNLLQVTEQNTNSNAKSLEEFANTKDAIERIKLLQTMDTIDAITCIRNHGSKGANAYLNTRIHFYNKLHKEQTIQTERWDYQRLKYYTIKEEVKVTPEILLTGLTRDIVYASMIGTPELAIQRMALHYANDHDIDSTHLPQLHGSSSGIKKDGLRAGSYDVLREIYSDAKQVILKKNPTDSTEEHIERKAVRLAAKWLTQSLEYNDPGRTYDSSYTSSSMTEQVAWARLGTSVQRQLRGMRQKIEGIDLHNIGRFIGKSGDNPYEPKLKGLKALRKRAKKDPNFKLFWRTNATDTSKPETLWGVPLNEESKEYTQATKAINPLTGNDAVAAITSEITKMKPKVDAHWSLAQKAIDLHFELADEELHDGIDWINDAPFSVINWAHKALKHGVPTKDIILYAKYLSIFGEIKRISSATQNKLLNKTIRIKETKDIIEVNKNRGISCNNEDLLYLGTFMYPSNYVELLDLGYSTEFIVKHSWLQNSIKELNNLPFPNKENPRKQSSWLAQHAFKIPSGWNTGTVGSIMLNRLDNQINTNIHDASYWFADFEMPDTIEGEVYKDPEAEFELLYSMCNLPKSLHNKISKKKSKYERLFSSKANVIVYETLLEVCTTLPIDMEALKLKALEKVDKVITEQNVQLQLEELLNLKDQTTSVCEKLAEEMQHIVKTSHREMPIIMQHLRQVSMRAQEYRTDAQAWVSTHSLTPQTVLTAAWQHRRAALANDVADNPTAINQWAKLNALNVEFNRLEKEKKLPDNITRADLETYNDWFTELIKHYSAKRSIKFVSWYKKKGNKKHLLPAQVLTLSDDRVGEILDKKDPRGATIGADTGCCMTLDGESSECIKVGYKKKNAGFMALNDENNQIIAQSLIWVNENTKPDTVVLDNIEVCEGRDMGKILDSYTEFFRTYLLEEKRKNPKFKVRKVYVGTGYTDVSLKRLAKAEAIEVPYEGYTDAEKQKVLLEIPEAEFEAAAYQSTAA